MNFIIKDNKTMTGLYVTGEKSPNTGGELFRQQAVGDDLIA